MRVGGRDGKVKGLVGRWEERVDSAARAEAERRGGKRHPNDESLRREVSIVYPLHVNRFVRRSSIGTPVRAQSPLQRSGRDEDNFLHAPRPTRTIPPVQKPPEMTDLQGPVKGDYLNRAAYVHGTGRFCVRHGRADHIRQHDGAQKGKRKAFNATTDTLSKSRSGVYIPTGQAERRQMDATSPWISPIQLHGESMEAGMLTTDIEACSDCLQELSIRRREVYQTAGPKMNDACTTQHSAARQVADGSAQTVRRTAGQSYQHLYAPASHTHTPEPSLVMDPELLATPARITGAKRRMAAFSEHSSRPAYEPAQRVAPCQPIRPLEQKTIAAESALDAQDGQGADDSARHTALHPPVSTTFPGHDLHDHSTVRTASTETIPDLVLFRNLKEGLNAVVVEHRGRLRRIILNKRNNVPESECLQSFSQELSRASRAVALAIVHRQEQQAREIPQYSLIVDQAPTPATNEPAENDHSEPASRAGVIPELLTLIAQTANDIRLDSHDSGPRPEDADHFASHRRDNFGATFGRSQSLLYDGEMPKTLFNLPSSGEQAAHRQSLGETIETAQQTISAAGTRKRPSTEAKTLEHIAKAATAATSASDTALPFTPASKVSQLPPRRESRPRLATAVSVTPNANTQTSKSAPVDTQLADHDSETRLQEDIAFTTPPAEASAALGQPDITTGKLASTTNQGKVDQHQETVATPATLTPRAVKHTAEGPQPHSYFPTFLTSNLLPCRRRIPNPSSEAKSDNAHSSVGTTRSSTKVTASPAPSLPSPSKPVETAPSMPAVSSPYPHAPSAPLNLRFAQHEDPGIRERKEVVRAAMRMERETRKARRESGANLLKRAGLGEGT